MTFQFACANWEEYLYHGLSPVSSISCRDIMRRTLVILASVLLLGACSASRIENEDQPVRGAAGVVQFVVVGDMPYNEQENAMLTAPSGAIATAVKALEPAVLIHVGDLKRGSTPCTDALLTTRRDQIFNLYPHKAVYTPGDNDWTDCDRAQHKELNRLAYLRTLFFEGDGLTLTHGLPGLVRQAGFAENALWKIDGLVFGTLHVVGTNNGRAQILNGDEEEAALDEADRRDVFNKQWIDKLFDEATMAPALVIAFHSDIFSPGAQNSNVLCTAENRKNCDGSKMVRDYLRDKSLQYNKPVLLIHGSTNPYCFHKLEGGFGPDTWRLNALGDYNDYRDAVQVTYDPNQPEMPFEVVGLVYGKAFPEVCNYN